MNGDERKKLVRDYKALLKKKEHFEKLKSEYEALLNDPIVKRYLELEDQIESSRDYNYFTTSKEEDLIFLAYNNARFESKSNIYICLGGRRINYEVDIVHGSHDYYDDKNPDYYLYENIEGYCGTETVRPQNKEAFEKDKIILYAHTGSVYKIKMRYACLVVREGLVAAKKIMLEEYGKKK